MCNKRSGFCPLGILSNIPYIEQGWLIVQRINAERGGRRRDVDDGLLLRTWGLTMKSLAGWATTLLAKRSVQWTHNEARRAFAYRAILAGEGLRRVQRTNHHERVKRDAIDDDRSLIIVFDFGQRLLCFDFALPRLVEDFDDVVPLPFAGFGALLGDRWLWLGDGADRGCQWVCQRVGRLPRTVVAALIASFHPSFRSGFHLATAAAMGFQSALCGRVFDTTAALLRHLRRGTRSATADASFLRWRTRSATADASVLRWRTRSATAKASLLRWRTRSATADASVLRWLTGSETADASVLRWRTGSATAKASLLRWRTRSATAYASVLRWRTRSATAKASLLRWRTRSATADASVLRWRTRSATAGSATANAALAGSLRKGGFRRDLPAATSTIAAFDTGL